MKKIFFLLLIMAPVLAIGQTKSLCKRAHGTGFWLHTDSLVLVAATLYKGEETDWTREGFAVCELFHSHEKDKIGDNVSRQFTGMYLDKDRKPIPADVRRLIRADTTAIRMRIP